MIFADLYLDPSERLKKRRIRSFAMHNQPTDTSHFSYTWNNLFDPSSEIGDFQMNTLEKTHGNTKNKPLSNLRTIKELNNSHAFNASNSRYHDDASVIYSENQHNTYSTASFKKLHHQTLVTDSIELRNFKQSKNRLGKRLLEQSRLPYSKCNEEREKMIQTSKRGQDFAVNAFSSIIGFMTNVIFFILLLGCIFQTLPKPVHANPIQPYDSNFPLDSWMEYFQHNISKIPLTQLVIPGTHDSGSYSISPFSNFVLQLPEFMRGAKLLQPIMKWQQTQGKDLYEQLSMGVRYFDIRVMHYDGVFYACHSSVRGEKIEVLLEQVSRFVKEHPMEIILFDIHQFLGFSTEHHKKLIELLKKYFPPNIVVSKKDHEDHLSTLSPGDLWKGTERIIIFYQDKDTCNENPDYVWSNDGSNEEDISNVGGYIYRPFSPGVRDVHQLSEFMVKTLQKRMDSDKFYVLPATLFWNQWNVVWGFMCGNSGCWGLTFPTSHRQFNEGYAHMIHEQVSDTLLRERKRVNIVMVDWTTEANNRLLIVQNLRDIN